jgi:hypothetical protein
MLPAALAGRENWRISSQLMAAVREVIDRGWHVLGARLAEIADGIEAAAAGVG